MTNTTTPAFDLYVPTSGEGLTHLHAENTTGILCGSARRYSTFNVMGIVPAGSATCEPCNRAAHRLERDAEVRAAYNATGPCGVGAPDAAPTTYPTKTITPAEYIALQRHDYAGDARTLQPETVATWRELYPDWNGQRWAMWWAGDGHGTTLGPVNVR